jgi:hypothetical protein
MTYSKLGEDMIRDKPTPRKRWINFFQKFAFRHILDRKQNTRSREIDENDESWIMIV